MRIFGKGKCKFIANFSATLVTSLPSLSVSLSLSHRKYLTHNIGSASALPIIRAQGVGGGHNTRIESAVFFLLRFLFFASSSSQGGFSAHFAQCSYAPENTTLLVNCFDEALHVVFIATNVVLGR